MTVAEDVASYLNNKKRRDILRLEEDAGMSVQIIGSKAHLPEQLDIVCHDAEGRTVNITEE